MLKSNLNLAALDFRLVGGVFGLAFGFAVSIVTILSFLSQMKNRYQNEINLYFIRVNAEKLKFS